ncbi:MAG: DUF302 domain-containing protein [Granulosicoccaceae bacterium]
MLRSVKSLLLAAITASGLISTAHAGMSDPEGMVVVPSPHSVKGTLDKLAVVLESKGMKIMARVDHSAGATSVDLALRPTELMIFGNPKAGTPLMLCSQSLAIDLPQKMLAWEDEAGKVWLGYNDPTYIKARHGTEGCDAVFEKISGALANFAKAATAP